MNVLLKAVQEDEKKMWLSNSEVIRHKQTRASAWVLLFFYCDFLSSSVLCVNHQELSGRNNPPKQCGLTNPTVTNWCLSARTIVTQQLTLSAVLNSATKWVKSLKSNTTEVLKSLWCAVVTLQEHGQHCTSNSRSKSPVFLWTDSSFYSWILAKNVNGPIISKIHVKGLVCNILP